MSDWPDVSVVMPVRDDAEGLPGAVAAVLAQAYPGRVEVVLGVAPSRDGTEAAAARLAAGDARVRVVDNPSGSTSAGLNRAIEASTGEVVARVDAHAELEPGYLRRAVEVLRATGADNVGGVQQAVGRTPFERAVATAMTSRLGVGNARFHYGGAPGPTDTVYLGVFRRAALERVGGFDETLVRNQDYELNWRLRATGGTVWFDPELRVRYRPRGSLRALARQYHEYGRWKREVLRRHPRSLRWRQLAPPLALLVNAAGLALGLGSRRTRLALAAPGLYAAALAATAPRDPRLPLVYATMHLAWGAGFLRGPGVHLKRRAASVQGVSHRETRPGGAPWAPGA
jgi:glycosyltransferase involved in cell wall biosynthesis